MDFVGIIETLGIPVAFALASFYATVFLIKWITGSLESLILNRFDEVRLIVIMLIDKQMEMEIKHLKILILKIYTGCLLKTI